MVWYFVGDIDIVFFVILISRQALSYAIQSQQRFVDDAQANGLGPRNLFP